MIFIICFNFVMFLLNIIVGILLDVGFFYILAFVNLLCVAFNIYLLASGEAK